MSNHTTTDSRFYADLNDYMMEEVFAFEAETMGEWSPVPREFWNMSLAEVEVEIADMWECTIGY